MARTRAEMDALRAENRSTLGLAGDKGLGAGIPDLLGVAGQAIKSIRVQTSFPETDFKYQPGATEPSEPGSGGVVADWILRHVTRPRVEVEMPIGVVALDPYSQESDYSGLAKGLAILTGVTLAGSAGWMVVRALWPTRRSNPRRRRLVGVR